MKPKFTITDRDGKKALWVNGCNIWDIHKKELSYDVKKAIINAYYIGSEDMLKDIRKIQSQIA